jgi:hypothetical protein
MVSVASTRRGRTKKTVQISDSEPDILDELNLQADTQSVVESDKSSVVSDADTNAAPANKRGAKRQKLADPEPSQAESESVVEVSAKPKAPARGRRKAAAKTTTAEVTEATVTECIEESAVVVEVAKPARRGRKPKAAADPISAVNNVVPVIETVPEPIAAAVETVDIVDVNVEIETDVVVEEEKPKRGRRKAAVAAEAKVIEAYAEEADKTGTKRGRRAKADEPSAVTVAVVDDKPAVVIDTKDAKDEDSVAVVAVKTAPKRGRRVKAKAVETTEEATSELNAVESQTSSSAETIDVIAIDLPAVSAQVRINIFHI